MHFSRPFIFNEDASQTIITSITLNNGFGIFSINSRSGSSEAEDIHMNGEYRLQATHLRASKFNRALASIERHVDTLCGKAANNELQFFSSRTVFDVLFRRIITYGERYRTLESFTLSPRGMEAVAQFKLPASLVRAGEGYFIQPAFVEALVQRVGLLAYHPEPDQRRRPAYIILQRCIFGSGRLMVADVYAIADTGSGSRQLVAHLKGLQLRRVRVDVLRRGLSVLATTSLKLPLKRLSRSCDTIINDEPASPPGKSVSVSSSPTLVPDDASDDPVPFDLDSGDHGRPMKKSNGTYGEPSYQARGKGVLPLPMTISRFSTLKVKRQRSFTV
ncbi:polyketide synthase [Salix suchowensis]|nr:polyketide synthase [Salix suchowensis]